jgi:ribosomal protein S18 acetylase RimI-like enzyme
VETLHKVGAGPEDEIDFKNVLKTINRYPAHLLPINRSMLRTFQEKGMVYWDDGVAIIAKRLTTKSYLKHPVPPGTTHLAMIASSRQRRGAADEVMKRLLHQAGNKIVLSVYAYNVRAVRFYKRHGLTKLGEYKFPNFSVDIYGRFQA